MWKFLSRDRIQIFSLDLIFDLLIGRHLILFLPRNSSKSVMAIPTASLVMEILYVSLVLSVCQQGLSGPATACLLRFQGLTWQFLDWSCTKYPDPKAGRPLDQDKPVCITSYQGGKPTQIFPSLFCGFLSLNPDFCSQPQGCRVGWRVGSSGTGV